MAVSAFSTRRWGAGTAAIVRLLVAATEPMTQVAIAAATCRTQPRVSQVLKMLAAEDAIRISERGYRGRRSRLIDLYGARARSHVDGESFWASGRSLVKQARRIDELARSDGTGVAFSGDLGAQLLGVTKHGAVAVVYATGPLAVVRTGMDQVSSRDEATLVVRCTADETLLRSFAPWPNRAGDLPITDPVQQWFDLVELGGDDRRKAAKRLRRAIVDRAVGQRPG